MFDFEVIGFFGYTVGVSQHANRALSISITQEIMVESGVSMATDITYYVVDRYLLASTST